MDGIVLDTYWGVVSRWDKNTSNPIYYITPWRDFIIYNTEVNEAVKILDLLYKYVHVSSLAFDSSQQSKYIKNRVSINKDILNINFIDWC